ncbi:MAG: hypothetical protein V2B19_25755 [Pseudomonadota bacterium]
MEALSRGLPSVLSAAVFASLSALRLPSLQKKSLPDAVRTHSDRGRRNTERFTHVTSCFIDIKFAFLLRALPEIQKLAAKAACCLLVAMLSITGPSTGFDDAYQYSLARHYGLKIVTMDKDISRIDSTMVFF